MKSRAFRLAPAVAALTAGLLLAGASGAAVATPSEESPSATGSAASKSDDKSARASWTKRGEYYHNQDCCHSAGDHGKRNGDWHDYKCEHHGHWWWLYSK
ncbi:hypothetical protein AF335_23220 [Streptomyces eurocidicus]|uniref:Uncharacterized protein n=1 Tax=Streptomyces eurocidicus TaxID=66423 RepID=A0A2N8NSL7_STREU|nr:hypothetical protein [Streptomyces eurocidicus]MBB5120008.1 hypothetical protein [Streptomyces eurocidicus]MBF6051832.1 hypothetical protein [Streptomyces eurocidicus]PNE31747.1 hypothetical protein AF335_23220 [Streptomyces eurocidicus]